MTNPPLELARAPVTEPAAPAAEQLTRLRAGHEPTWTEIFRQLWPIALRAAQHPAACLTNAEAEEIANESLALIVPQVQRVDSIDALKALLATVAHRRAISAARAKSAAKRSPTHSNLENEIENEADTLAADNPALSDWQRAELALLLQQAMDKLDPSAQTLLQEKTGEGLSFQQISDRHGIPLGTLCAKFTRSLHQIRRRLEAAPNLMKELREFLR